MLAPSPTTTSSPSSANWRRRLQWPSTATIKDFRHLFATCLENAGMPEHYRKYLMGQSPGRAAIVTYTHLNEIRQRYEEAVLRQIQPLVDVIDSVLPVVTQ